MFQESSGKRSCPPAFGGGIVGRRWLLSGGQQEWGGGGGRGFGWVGLVIVMCGSHVN